MLTGAGVSAESGIATFRSPGGLWRNFRAEDLATPEAFARDPILVWQWYDWRRGLIAAASPNPGHAALVLLEGHAAKFTLITQNVDGLHDRAGSRNVLKVHGDIWILRCTKCPREWRDDRTPLPEIPPRCECGALARPGVVWFGEGLPQNIWKSAEEAAATCDVFVVAGTSGVVYPAAGLVALAKRRGALTVEINVAESAVSPHVDHLLRGASGEILPALAGIGAVA